MVSPVPSRPPSCQTAAAEPCEVMSTPVAQQPLGAKGRGLRCFRDKGWLRTPARCTAGERGYSGLVPSPFVSVLKLAASPAGRKVIRQAVRIARTDEGRKLLAQGRHQPGGTEANQSSKNRRW